MKRCLISEFDEDFQESPQPLVAWLQTRRWLYVVIRLWKESLLKFSSVTITRSEIYPLGTFIATDR